MDTISGVIGSGALLLSFFAYREAADVLQSSARLISPGRARAGALCAAGITTTAWLLLCQGLGA